MTGIDAMKHAVEFYYAGVRMAAAMSDKTIDEFEKMYYGNKPAFVVKFLQIIHRLKHEVYNPETKVWEYEGF